MSGSQGITEASLDSSSEDHECINQISLHSIEYLDSGNSILFTLLYFTIVEIFTGA